MKPALKEKWIKALRSGRYRQGKNTLKEGRYYCCLGVLCTVAGAKWKPNREGMEIPFIDGKQVSALDEHYLSTTALRRFGFRDKRQKLLANFNDGHPFGQPAITRKNFKEIADYIEEHM